MLGRRKYIKILTEIRDNQITGGQKYNSILFSLINRSISNVEFLTDDKFIKTNVSILYNLIYFPLLFKRDMDILILDSRMYPRFFLISLLFRIFRLHVRIICIHHHFNFKARQSILVKPFAYVLEMFFLLLCHEIVIPSRYSLELCRKLLPNKKSTLIPIGLKKDNIELVTIPEKSQKNLLFVGSMNRRKGIKYLILALSEIRGTDYILNLVGTFRDRGYVRCLKRLVRLYDLENNIIFLGRLQESELGNYFQDAYCFVFPSLYEGFGMVIAEAFSYGLPVIAFNNSAIPYLVEDQYNGYLVNNKNPKEFASAIERIFSSRKEYLILRANAYNTYMKLPSYDEMVFNMENWIKTSLNKPEL